MYIKRTLAFMCAVLIIFSLTACKGNKNGSAMQESTKSGYVANETVLYTDTTVYETTSEYFIQETTQPTTTMPTETTTTEVFDDPGNWSIERIIEEYKNAARKSNSTAKSKQKIVIKKISVNDGEHEKVMSFITSIIGKFLESNSTEKIGVTGGFENLVPEDINTAKAYKSGDGTTIELTLVEQSSGAKEDALSGSVGHAITAVGDIDEVVQDLSERGLPLELSEEDTKIHYTNPVVKVTINDNGEVVSGTWSYTVEISMNNFKAFGQNVEKASIIMENTITV